MSRAAEVLFELIEQRLAPGADLAAIDQKIWAMFGETWAVLCSDMSGFTRRTEEFGITHFLSLIYEMRRLMKLVILNYNGLTIKTQADNLFVIFRQPEQAVRCAIEMHHAAGRYSESKTVDYQIAVCIGIGYGQVLKLGDEDCFGSEVNRAFKLGEDIARAGETLLTPSAYEALRDVEDLSFIHVSPSETEILSSHYKLAAPL